MGLDAYVRCRCWSDERPPEPDALRGLIELDDGEPFLSPGYSGNRKALYGQLRDYISSFCPHEEMRLVSEWLGSWSRVGHFVEILRELDANRFSTLIHVFPEANGGEVDSELLPRLLSELDQFDSLGIFGRRLVLVQEESDYEICSVGIDTNYVFAVGPEQVQGLSPRGFYVRRGSDVVFQSRHFEQVLLWPEGGNAPVAQFRAIDSDQVCDGAIAISHRFKSDDKGRAVPDYGRRFLVRIAPHQSSDYRSMTGSLRRLFEAALQTGNPVRWS